MIAFDVTVVPVLFRHSLKEIDEQRVTYLDHIFSFNAVKIRPSIDAEVVLALLVLEVFFTERVQSWLIDTSNSCMDIVLVFKLACLMVFIILLLVMQNL